MTAPTSKPVLLSGSAPTGTLTIGNYLGAIRHWVSLQDTHDCLFGLVDLHALTVPNDPALLLRRSQEFVALYLACGIDPTRSLVFVQSHVPQHAQLAWVLNCIAPFGRLGRMTQFKEKADKRPDNVNAGLFTYPVLMAADILLYDTQLVPVGEDQKQHLELTRDLASSFNHTYGDIFTMPEPYIAPFGARIMSLQDPTRKMDKSDANPANYIGLLDEPDVVRRKIRRAVTDPGSEIVFDESKPGISNLLSIHACLSGTRMEELHDQYQGRGYGHLKDDLVDIVIDRLKPIQERYRSITEDRQMLRLVLKNGSQQAQHRAQKKVSEVYSLLGLID